MKITVCRLRSGINYKRPLLNILDSYCFLLQKYMIEEDHTFGYYNFGFGEAHRRNSKDVPDADVLIIPSENEFHYHIDKYIDPKNLAKSNKAIEDHILPYLKGKHVIILRSDRGDTEELYREKTFKGIDCKISILDETDIPGNVHQLKYWFIKDYIRHNKFDETRDIRFTYWGTEKRNDDSGVSGDQRHVILKEIQDGEGRFNTRFYGRFSRVKRDDKSMTMEELVPTLLKTQFTLCFNWKDPTATTSRYHEAMACGVIPLVWKDYDSTGELVKNDWQRVNSVSELHQKMLMTDHNTYHQMCDIQAAYEPLNPKEIFSIFKDKLNALL